MKLFPKKSWWMTILMVLILFLTVYPLVWLLFGSFWSSAPGDNGHFTLEGYIEAYSDPKFFSVLINTLFIVITTVIFSISLAVFLAWIVTRTNTPRRAWLETLIYIGYFTPPTLTAMAWILLASPETGLINQLFDYFFGIKPFNIYTRWGIIWHMMLSFTSFAFILMLAPFRTMDSTLEEAGRISGNTSGGVFLRITLPILSPVIISSAILIFIRGMEAFEGPAFLGIPGKITVFMTQIYDAIAFRQPPKYAMAMALAVTLLAITIIIVFFQWWYMRGKSFVTVTGKNYKPAIVDLKKWKYLTFTFVVFYFSIVVVLPLSQLILTSFQQISGIYNHDMFTLDNYKMIFNDALFWKSLRNTLLLSSVGAFLCMFLCSLVAYVIVKTNYSGKKALDLISWLPWTIPGMVLALGMLWGYIIIPKPFNIYGTFWILLLAYIIQGIPLGVRNMTSALHQLSNDLEESARIHGATWWISFRTIIFSLIRPNFVAGWLLLFVMFSRELSASILLYSYGTEVLSVSIFNYWSAGKSEAVSAISVIFIIIILLMLLLERLYISWFKQRQEKKILKATGESNQLNKQKIPSF